MTIGFLTMLPSGLAMRPDVMTGPGIHPGTMAVTAGTAAGTIPGITMIRCSMAAGHIMATMASILLGPMAGMILIGTALGITAVITPHLGMSASIITQFQLLVQVPSEETVRPTEAVIEVFLPIMPAT